MLSKIHVVIFVLCMSKITIRSIRFFVIMCEILDYFFEHFRKQQVGKKIVPQRPRIISIIKILLISHSLISC